MSPTDHYDALIQRISQWAIDEVCGKGKKPKTNREVEDVERRIAQTIEHAEIFHFTPHPKQDWFMRAKAPITAAVTGNKWGKTVALLSLGMVSTLHCVPWAPRDEQEEAYARYSKVASDYEPPIQVVLSGPDMVTWLPMNIVPRLKKLIPWDALVVKTSRQQGQVIDGIEFWNGSSWKILSYMSEPERYEGWSCHLKLWDEPMDRVRFISASRGCIEFQAPHVMSFTPENLRDAFVVDDIVLAAHHITSEESFNAVATQKPQIVVVEGSLYDNPYIPQEAKEQQVLMWTAEERISRVEGKLRFFVGAVYKSFSRDKHVKELEALVG